MAGLGLFGTGVRGLAQVDEQLASATERPATHQVRQELDAGRLSLAAIANERRL